MMLRHSLDQGAAAELNRKSGRRVLNEGYRTAGYPGARLSFSGLQRDGAAGAGEDAHHKRDTRLVKLQRSSEIDRRQRLPEPDEGKSKVKKEQL